MKHFISLAAAAATLLLAASCSIKEDRIQCQAPVCVTVVNEINGHPSNPPFQESAGSLSRLTQKGLLLARKPPDKGVNPA